MKQEKDNDQVIKSDSLSVMSQDSSPAPDTKNKKFRLRCGICYRDMGEADEINNFSYCGCENDKTDEEWYYGK